MKETIEVKIGKTKIEVTDYKKWDPLRTSAEDAPKKKITVPQLTISVVSPVDHLLETRDDRREVAEEIGRNVEEAVAAALYEISRKEKE